MTKNTRGYQVTFWKDNYSNDIQRVYVLAESREDAIYKASQKTGLNILATQPSIYL